MALAGIVLVGAWIYREGGEPAALAPNIASGPHTAPPATAAPSRSEPMPLPVLPPPKADPPAIDSPPRATTATAATTESAEAALQRWTTTAKSTKRYSKAWWEAKHGQFEAMHRLGKTQVVRDSLENLRLLIPTLGGAESAARFEDLAAAVGLDWDR